MTRRIFWSTLLAQVFLMILCTVLTVRASFLVSEKTQRVQLREVAEIISRSYMASGDTFIEGYMPTGYNITIINKSGKIINDDVQDSWYLVTDSSALVSFLSKVVDSNDIVEAKAHILTGELLCAGRSFEDGTILVVNTIMNTMWDTLFALKYHLSLILLFAIGVSFFIANFISKTIMKPLNNINLDAPVASKYKEIQPLISKIHDQRLDIAIQQDQLEQRESQFNAITESIQEGLILIDRKKNVSFINPSAIKILNLEESPLGSYYRALQNEELNEIIHKAIRTGDLSKTITISPFSYQVEATPIIADEQNAGVALLIYDITRRVNEENRRRDFTANVSHELKTPLHVISGCAELLNSGLVKQEDQMQFIKQIHSQSQRMTQLVTDIIEISRLEEGSEAGETEPIDMMAVASNVAENLKSISLERNISITNKGSQAWVKSTYTVIYELIYNLVDNALKYTEKGGHVIVTTWQTESEAILTVKDNGIGIAEEHLDRIFERFYRVDKSRSREVGGTGLGLAIVKHAAITSGGKVTIESKPNVGSTFTATFPRCERE